MSNKTLGKPESHSDVVNRHPTTLLIGYGWVGQQVHKYFAEACWYTPTEGLHDLNGDRIDGWFAAEKRNVVAGDQHILWEIGFISTPSPMNKDGSCDTSYVESAVRDWHQYVKTFIIRSTVTPGTTDRLQKLYPDNHFVMQPEYLGETLGHPMLDVDRQTFVILGGTSEATRLAANAWSRVLHAGAKIRQVTAKTAEICKYMENSFLAVKVLFVNEFAQLAREVGVDFLELREAWLDDPRIGRSHTFAYEENPGFSGKCLPKDVNSICHYGKQVGKRMDLMESVLKINAKMREGIKTTVPLLPQE